MRPTYPSLRRRPFVTPIWLSLLAALAALAALGALSFVAWEGSQAYPTIIVLMASPATEHAAGDDSAGALLSRLWGPRGGTGHLDAIVVRANPRDQSMAAPLAASLGLRPIVASDEAPRELAHRLLRDEAGKRVLVLLEAGALGRLIESLGGAGSIPIPRSEEFGTLYIVTVPRFGHADVLLINH